MEGYGKVTIRFPHICGKKGSIIRHLMQVITKRKRKYLGAGLLLTTISSSTLTSGCALNGLHKDAQDLIQDTPKEEVETVDMMEPSYESVSPQKELTEFSLELLGENLSHGNCLTSPLFIVSALGMTANGAEDNTRTQMEQMMHMGTAVPNDYLRVYTGYTPNGETCQVNIANSVWSRDGGSLTINEDLLKTSRSYYDASIFEVPFDAGTRDNINSWVKKETNDMTQKLLEEALPRDTAMYLINVLSFDGKRRDIYRKNQIHKETFNAENGERRSAESMYSIEAVYPENTLGRGFLKLYGGGAYTLAAILPGGGMAMKEFLERLEENGITDFLEQTRNKAACVRLPKFIVEYNVVLNESLMESGMKGVFDSQRVGFSFMVHSNNDNIYINKVVHKTRTDVDEKGVKVGVVTAVEVSEDSVVQTEEPREVSPDRPFFYMIIDTRQNFPPFMGCLIQLE